MSMDGAILERYSTASKGYENGLCCCAIDYDPKYLKAIPEEVLDRDYGCGDPTRYVRPGEVVLDLGSGSGKVCFIAAQIVGPQGRVIGVDMNDDMLGLARRAQLTVAERLQYNNVEFRKGRIEDLGLNLELVDDYLRQHPVRSALDLSRLQDQMERFRTESPLIPDNSVDVIISNCVLNLVSTDQKRKLFAEIHRVLKPGGRAVISDIVSDEDVPLHLQQNPELWSGCYSGAIREDLFIQAFTDVGMYGVEILKRDGPPWQIVEGIEFRSVTVVAYKGKEGPCWDLKQAVIYRGPFKRVEDDDGHTLERGVRMAICDKTYRIFSREPYRAFFEFVDPNTPVELEAAQPFPCDLPNPVRHPRETKYGENLLGAGSASCACAPAVGQEYVLAATPPEAVTPVEPLIKPKQIYIFEQACCAPTTSATLVTALKRRLGEDSDIQIFDLGKASGRVPVPFDLLLKIQQDGNKCLPALVVDGQTLTEGWLPRYTDLASYFDTGRPLSTAARAEERKSCC